METRLPRPLSAAQGFTRRRRFCGRHAGRRTDRRLYLKLLNLKGVSANIQQIVKGVLIIFAVSADIAGKNKKIKLAARNKKEG